MSNFSMVAAHAANRSSEDRIFAASKQATDAAAKYGKTNVVNATIGAIMDDEEKLAILPSVLEVFKSLPPEEIAAYAPIAGTPDFLDASIKAAFRELRPDAFIKAVATPGGSGAISHTAWIYSSIGDTILTSDWYWGPYKTIADENLRKLDTFKFFTEDKKFNISSFEEKVIDILKRQDNLVILLNSPAHNPTGFALSDYEWELVFEVLKSAASNKDKKIVVFSDIAYIDYAGTINESRSFMRNFSKLPENILVIVGYSISKTLTMYGLRTGAMIGISSNKDIAQEFYDACQFSNRGTWSNGTRCGMKLLATIMNDEAILKKVEAEREFYRKMLVDRASIFMREAKEACLDICPYKAGFFVTVPSGNPEFTAETLKKDNIFAVPLSGGVRFAVCSVPEYKMGGVAAKFKNAVV